MINHHFGRLGTSGPDFREKIRGDVRHGRRVGDQIFGQGATKTRKAGAVGGKAHLDVADSIKSLGDRATGEVSAEVEFGRLVKGGR